MKKSLRLSPNPQYAVEEFTYVPADNNEINYDQEDNEIDSIGNNRNIPSLNNREFRKSQKYNLQIDRRH